MKRKIDFFIALALLSISSFFFNFLGAEGGLEVYLGLCATFLVAYLYGKHYGKIQ